MKYVTFFLLLLLSSVSFGEVLYTFDYEKEEYIVGEKKERLLTGYTKNRKYSDKRSRLTGSFMKRWFGMEKELRYTTVILLDSDILRQIDYGKEKILETKLSKLTDPKFHEKIRKSRIPEVKQIINERYIVRKPIFKIFEVKDRRKLKNYPVRNVKAELTLETFDKKKKAVSRTVIDLDLYLTDKIEGYDTYRTFYRNISGRLGVNAAKFGNLERLLTHWPYSLDKLPVKRAEGFPVKTVYTVKGIYITNQGNPSEKRIEKVLQKVNINLIGVKKGKFNPSLFEPPEKWKVKKG